MEVPALPAGLRTRLAPTPSGPLHPGNGASFVLTWKLARQAGGKVLLRIDDLDAERMRPEYVDDIFRTLEWLGIDWDEGPSGPDDLIATWSQRHRIERYQALVDRLRAAGVVYACTCSRSTMAACTCKAAGLAFGAEGVTWRVDLQQALPVEVHQWPGGDARFAPGDRMPVDPVIRQRNGRPAYQVASLADDLDRDIDFIVRGVDLLPSTLCQLHLARVLGAQAFMSAHFVHHGLLLGSDGEKLSKSRGAGSLRAMREAGADPAVVHDLADALLAALLRGDQA